jgi:transglutaminase-like putative cysteine protease
MQSCVSTEAVDYEVVHTSKYEYTEAVSVSHHVARLRPRVLPCQECVRHDLKIEPEPAVVATHQDYFGNAATFFAMQGAHKSLIVSARSRVPVRPRETPPPSATPPWEAASDRAALPLDAFDWLFDASPARVGAELDAYARPSFPVGRPLLEAVLELTRRIYEDFTFDPRATTVATPLTEVLKLRRGLASPCCLTAEPRW